jgi:hypothetical protein
LIYSFTAANDFQICKRRYFHKHIAKDVEQESSPALEYGNLVHKAFEKRLDQGIPFSSELAHLEPFALAVDHVRDADSLQVDVERRLGIRGDGLSCGFYEPSCAWRGKLDLVVRNDTIAQLYDWKTGKAREDPFELEVQAVLLRAAYPSIKVFKGRYIWLREEKLGATHQLDPSRTWARMKELGQEINEATKMNYWPEQENPLCAWCPAKQCRFNRA